MKRLAKPMLVLAMGFADTQTALITKHFSQLKKQQTIFFYNIIELICFILTSEYLLLMNLFMRADFPTFESPIRTTLQSWRASDKRWRTLPILILFTKFLNLDLSVLIFRETARSLYVFSIWRLHGLKTRTQLN